MKLPHFAWIISLFSLVFLLSGCRNEERGALSSLEKNLLRAGENRAELEGVLEHYRVKGDSLGYLSAVALISNMESQYHYGGTWLDSVDRIFDALGMLENPDKEAVYRLRDSFYTRYGPPAPGKLEVRNELRTLTADFLIHNIDGAIEAWQHAPWRDSIDFEMFCNYILPYKNYQEYPEYWREELYQKYKWCLEPFYSDTSMLEATCAFNSELQRWLRFTDALDQYPGRISLSNLMQGKRGNCADMSGLAAYVGRALGIPIGLDYTPQWGAGSDGHAWNALILNRDTSIPFVGSEGHPGTYTWIFEGESRIARVWRRQLLVNPASFAAGARDEGIPIASIPGYANDLRLKDVTRLYGPVADISLSGLDPDRKVVYLCLYYNGGWIALQGSVIAGDRKAWFRDMGRALLYKPMYYERNRYVDAGPPILLTFDGETIPLEPAGEKMAEMVLTRKSPNSRMISKWSYAEYLNDAQIEASNDPDFRQSEVLHVLDNVMEPWVITETVGIRYRDQMKYEELWEERPLDSDRAFRYVRLRFKPDELFRLGDLEFFEKGGTEPLDGRPIGTISHPEWAFDGTHGHGIIYDERKDSLWVGLDLGQPKRLETIRFIPAQDRNRVHPDRTYQLFYWDGEWKLHEEKRSDGLSLSFSDVLDNTLYRLHCLDCRHQAERPFTYQEGEIFWW